MKLTFFTTIIVFSWQNFPAHGKIQTYLKNVTSTFDKDIVDVVHEIATSQSHDDANYHINLTITLKKELKTVFMEYQVLVNPFGRANESFSVAKETLNFCQILKKRNDGDRITAFMLNIWSKFGRMPRTCPIAPVRIFSFSFKIT